VIKREVKLEEMLNRLIDRGGYTRNRQPILDSINVTAAALSQYTRGRTRPSFEKLVGLADFFGVSLDYLVYGKPISSPVDPAPIARYVDQAFTEAVARTNQHSDLVARIGRLITDRIDDVAKEAVESRSAGIEGLIYRQESLRVERYCLQVDIVTSDLTPDIYIIEQGATAVQGQFFPVVVDNLRRGCTYRFLLTGDLTVQHPVVGSLREMIKEAVGGDTLHERCFFRTAAQPVANAFVVYNLDMASFAAAEPALHAQFEKYLLNQTWLGYVIRPNDDSTADMLMAPDHTKHSHEAFSSLWTEPARFGRPLGT
jgi:transcriptional regulator with XRE-family HTH domain